MNTQNITISLPIQLLRQIELIAAKRQTSVSDLLVEQLEKLSEKEGVYAHAKRRHLALLNNAPDLGTYGKIALGRDRLHKRQGFAVKQSKS